MLFVIGVRQLTWSGISLSNFQAFVVPKKRTVAPFIDTRVGARLSIAPSMATNAKSLNAVGDGSVCMDVGADEHPA